MIDRSNARREELTKKCGTFPTVLFPSQQYEYDASKLTADWSGCGGAVATHAMDDDIITAEEGVARLGILWSSVSTSVSILPVTAASG